MCQWCAFCGLLQVAFCETRGHCTIFPIVESGFELRQFNFRDLVHKDYTTYWGRRRELKEKKGRREECWGYYEKIHLPVPSLVEYNWTLVILYMDVLSWVFDMIVFFEHMIKIMCIIYPQDSRFRMALWDLVKINTVAWEGTVSSAERQGKQSVPAWTFANGTTNQCVDLMANSMKTIVKCTELLAWRNKRSPSFTMTTVSWKVNAGWIQSVTLIYLFSSSQRVPLSLTSNNFISAKV